MAQETDSDNRQAVKWQDLLDAFAFVNEAQVGEHSARLSRATGQIVRHSTWTDLWDDSGDDGPEVRESGDTILEIPHKTQLGLGRELVLWFVEEIIPDLYDDVALFFEKRGAYAKFKALLTEEGLLHQWYDFEKQAEEEGLRNWCAENAVTIIEEIPTA